MAMVESRGRQRVRPDLPVPPRLRSRHATAVRADQVRAQAMGAGTPPRRRSRHRGAVRPEPARAPPVDSPPRPQAQGQGTDRPVLLPRPRAPHAPAVQPYRYNGSPLAPFLYVCAALGAAVLIWLCTSLPPPSYGSLRGYRGLVTAVVAVVVAALIVILFRRHPPRLVDHELPDRPNQILAAPAPQPKQTPFALTGSILNADQVASAIRSSMADITRPFHAVSPPQADSSDSDGGGSSSNRSEIINYWYTPIHLMEAGDAHLIVPGFFQQLQEVIRGLSEADAVEMLRRAFRDANKSDFFYRLSDVLESQCVFYADAHGVTNRSTGTLVMMTKITAKLLHLIWFELDGQNQQLCQEVKMECFREIAGQSIEKLLDVALSLSNGRWSADHSLTNFDALVDVLYNISDLPLSITEFIPNEVDDILDLPLNRYELVHNVVAHIFCKMVVDFRGILEATTNGKPCSRESTIHPATVLLVQFLEFFYRNGEMMQSVLGTGDCTIELSMISSWVSKLGGDAEIMFQVKGQRYIFVLNNIFYVYQMKDRPGGFISDIELRSLCLLIQRYKKSYFDECWVPLTNTSRLNLDKFTAEFLATWGNQRTLKVTAELKYELRQEIVDLIVPPYEDSLSALQANQSRLSGVLCSFKRVTAGKKKQKKYTTGEELAEEIRVLFEG